VVATYSLRDALQAKVLCEYEYQWVPCSFDEDEADEYERITTAIAALVVQDDAASNPAIRIKIQALAARRSRLLGALRDKYVKFRGRLEGTRPIPHTLFYCGEGTHPLDVDEGEERNVDKVISQLAASGWKIGRITAAESVPERYRTLRSFDDGFIEAIAAIRVLDEGFDIPSCRTAYLMASSSSHRQYVQRRGRVLRQAPGKDMATIIDFVAIASPARLKNNKSIWRRQVESELVRVREFVQLARNSEEQQVLINRYLEDLGLASIYYEAQPISDEELYGD
jgi:superfamily II DNA or RNA helicase